MNTNLVYLSGERMPLLVDEDDRRYFVCVDVGVSGTTPVHLKVHDTGDYEVRCGIALFGETNMTDEQFAACHYNPFHPEFHDNYCVGKGKNEQEAIADLKENMKKTADSLFL